MEMVGEDSAYTHHVFAHDDGDGHIVALVRDIAQVDESALHPWEQALDVVIALCCSPFSLALCAAVLHIVQWLLDSAYGHGPSIYRACRPWLP